MSKNITGVFITHAELAELERKAEIADAVEWANLYMKFINLDKILKYYRKGAQND